MSEFCQNCDAEITSGGLLKGPNFRIDISKVNLVNFVKKTEFSELCDKCGKESVYEISNDFTSQIDISDQYIRDNITDFPMMTIGQLPQVAAYKIKTLITANVSVGTGFFSEFSQGFSDIFGRINVDSGMAYKVNSGEAAARSILATKAMNLGANCIIGVDVDYGTTANNAATINMQGTAVSVSNLADILDQIEFSKALKIHEAYQNIIKHTGWLRGDFKTPLIPNDKC
jgi:uncharacterized protein YbjQ (UPF0145 family)